MINSQSRIMDGNTRSINSLSQLQKRDTEKLLKVLSLYSELATCGVMDGKRKENLKAEIIELINSA